MRFKQFLQESLAFVKKKAADGDIKSVGEWLDCDPSEIDFNYKLEPITKFKKSIDEMQGTYDEFPKDKRRTDKIVNELKKGGKPLAIFVDPEDNFIMEGRHRIVGFWIAGLKKVPVFYVKCKKLKESYISQIPKLTFKPVSDSVWETIQDEGLDEEQNKPNRQSWEMAELKVSTNDQKMLKGFDDDTLEKFNDFDIKLKDKYKLKYIDLIDYDKGKITIVRVF